MRKLNLLPLFLLFVLVSSVFVGTIPYSYSDDPTETNVSNLTTSSALQHINPNTNTVIYAVNRIWIFFCSGLSYSFTSSELGSSGRVWRPLANVSIVNDGDCDTGGFSYDINFNGTHFHTVWRENIANSTFRYMTLLPDTDGDIQKLRQETITTDGTGGASIIESGAGNLYAITRFDAVTDDLHLYRSINHGSTWTEIVSLGETPIDFTRFDVANMTLNRAIYTFQLVTSLHYKIFYPINASFGTLGTIESGLLASSLDHNTLTDTDGLIHINYKASIGGSFRDHYTNFTDPDWASPTEWQCCFDSNRTSGIVLNSDGNGTTVFQATSLNLRFAIQDQSGSWENGTETHAAWTNNFPDTDKWSYTPRANSTGFYAMVFINRTSIALGAQQISIHIFGINQAAPPPTPPPSGDPIPAPPNPFGEGNETTFLTMIVEDDRGNLRINYALGETMIFDISLQFVNSTTRLVQDGPVGSVINLFRFDEFFDAFTLVGSVPTIDRFNGLGPRARIPIVHIDGLMPTTDFRANFTGNFFFNITSAISNIQTIITIADDEIPLSIGTRLSPPSVEGTRTGTIQDPLIASNIISQNVFSHGEPFRVSTFLTRSDTGATLAFQRVFLEMDINATGNFVPFQTLETNSVGRASSEFRIWDTRFVGEQRFRFIFFASAPFTNTTSVNGTAFVASTSSDFRLTIELIPSTVFPGDRVEIRGQLTNIANNQFGTPMPNERIIIFVSSFDKTAFFDLQVTSSSRLIIRTDTNGLYSHVIFGPNIGGASSQTMDFFANSSINSVVATSANTTLTINSVSIAPPLEIGEVQPTNFLLFSFLIDNPKANCQFSDPKTCSTMSWMLIVFIVSSVLAMVSFSLKLPGEIIGIGWIFMMLGGLIMGVAVGAVLELLLFIGALPVIVILIMSVGSIIRMKGASRGVDTA